MQYLLALILICRISFLAAQSNPKCGGEASFQILHFTKTNGFDHNTRSQSAQMFSEIGQTENFTIVDTQDASIFDDLEQLLPFEVIVWSNTSGNNILDETQQANMEAYIEQGGAYLGIHAATDTYRNRSWPFYNNLVGAIVQSNPNHTSQNYVGTMDVNGRVLKHLQVYGGQNQIVIDNLKKGIYYVRFRNNDFPSLAFVKQ